MLAGLKYNTEECKSRHLDFNQHLDKKLMLVAVCKARYVLVTVLCQAHFAHSWFLPSFLCDEHPVYLLFYSYIYQVPCTVWVFNHPVFLLPSAAPQPCLKISRSSGYIQPT
jgi:hypothetical protein